MGLLDRLETQLERQIPPNSKPALQQALDDYQPLCDHCRLAMHRHHRYARAIATSYGEVRMQIPVFRCGQCQGLRHLATGQVAHLTTSRLERHNRELRRREQLGTVWTEHNLLVLLQEQGLLNQTT